MRLTNANAQINTLWSDFPLFLTATTLVILSLSSLPTTWAALSDKRLCADEKCERIISMGTAKISYLAGEEGMLPFKIHSPIRIMSKSAGSNPKLWGVEINGRRGYANKDFILEKKIFIKDSDLTYELPLQSAKPVADEPAAPPAPIVNNPTETAQQLEDPLQQPVLNASETADNDAAATATVTTTSPLDTLNLAILTEQDQQATSGEAAAASTPITPVQANLQLIDGTQLPLEAVPATTERDSNLTKDDIKPKANIEERVPTTTTTSNEEFDQNEEGDDEEDDEDVYNDDAVDDDDEASSLDSKDNEYRKANETEGDKEPQQQKTLEIKAAPEVLVTKSETESSSQVIPSTTNQLELQLNSSNAAEKNAIPEEAQTVVDALSAAANVTELPVAAAVEPPKVIQPAVPLVAVLNNEDLSKLKADTVKKEEKVQSVKSDEAEKVKQVEVEKAKTTLKETEPTETKSTEAQAKQTENEAQDVGKLKDNNVGVKIDDDHLEIATETLPVIEPIDKAQFYEPVKPLSIQAQVTESSTQAQESEPQVVKAESKAPSTATPVEAQPVAVDVVATEPQAAIAVEAQSHLNELPKEAQQTEAQAQLQLEADAPLATDVELKKNSETFNETQPSADQLIVQEPKADKAPLKTDTDTVAAAPEVTTVPSVEPVQAASLPPLLKKQPNYNDPNEFYKEMQKQREQQNLAKKLELEAQLVEQRKIEEQQKKAQQEADQLKEAQLKEEKLWEAQLKEEKLREAQLKEEKLREAQLKEEKLKEEQLKEEQLKAEQLKEEQLKVEQYKEAQQQEVQQQQIQSQEQLPVTTPSYDAYDTAYEAEATPAPVPLATGTVELVGSPPSGPETPIREDAGLGLGLFSTIMSTVNSFISNEGAKEPETAPLTANDELHRLLYSQAAVPEVPGASQAAEGHCTRPMDGTVCHASINLDNFPEIFAAKVLDNSLLLLCVVISAASSLFFVLVYYCFCNSSQEGALLSKLNHLERSLLAAHKENLIIKHDLTTTRTKLSSIEDNSFGSNDMVAALKKQLETELYEKGKLQEQVSSLEKDLDNAAEAGLELNKMLSEVLNSQNGDEAFMSTVEELQRQLNDQDKVISEINANLAEKSRENSELQYSYTESTTRLTSEMKSLQQDNYELEMEKAKLQTRIEEIQAETEQELTKALEARNYEMQRLQHQIMEASAKFDKEHNELQTSLAKIDALEECLRQLKKDGNTNVQELIVSAKTRGELNAAHKKYLALQTKLEQELAAKARLENQLQTSSADVEQLKQDFNQSERDKLEAQTRLEVLSGYFREKETQLQKELSLQEAKWLQHQGENASTVETQTLMKNEIQTLKSQNDELRAEIEAQIASHKAQMGTLENRAHESWLAARQSERRCEEAQAEAAALRRKLTTMASGGGLTSVGEVSLEALPTNGGILAPELNSNSSPLPLPGSPGILNMPNPLPFLPAPFSPFMGLPPPFLPPPHGVASGGGGSGRLPPLGRMRSPPPTSSSRGGDRYSSQRDERDDYSDYDDYDEEEEDEHLMDRRRRHSGSWGRGRQDDYMHSPRTYRSLSPSDSRYNYNNDTETDYSPPPSPPPPRKNSTRPISEV